MDGNVLVWQLAKHTRLVGHRKWAFERNDDPMTIREGDVMSDGRVIEVKLAKAEKVDIDQMVKFFHTLEEALEYGTCTASDGETPEEIDDERLLEMIREAWNERGPGVGTAWRRVVWGCETLIANCCDPDSDVLEWRKDVREWLESQADKQESVG